MPAEVAVNGSVGFARSVFAVSYDRELLKMPGAGFHEGLPDMELVLDAEPRESWQTNTNIALGDLYADDQPFGLCARTQLKRCVSEWQALGYTPMVGLETEAYVFQRDSDGIWRPYDTPGAFVYGTGPENDPRGLTDDIWEAAQKAGIPIESMNGEYDNGQFEFTLQFTDAVKACDDAFLLRSMAREIAFRKGLCLSFLPKPIPDRGGSGLHINFSLTNSDNENIIAPHGKLSDIAEHCIAGLLAHHESLAGLLATTLNSYDRLDAGSMAGYWANWAEDHRMVSIRSATRSAKSARLEHRMADCACNPYQAVTAVLQAARLGVLDKSPVPPAEDLDGIERVRATRHVPSTLDKALQALDKDKVLRQAVGELYCDALLYFKRDECSRLRGKSVDEVRDFYLPFV